MLSKFLLAYSAATVSLCSAALAQQSASTQSELAAAKSEYVKACNVAAMSGPASNGRSYLGEWFEDSRIRDRMTDIQSAVAKRIEGLRTRTDPIERETRIMSSMIENYKRAIGNLGRNVDSADPRRVGYATSITCFEKYAELLRKLDEPSRLAMRQQLDQDSASRVDRQAAVVAATQRTADEAAAQRARQQKEADVLQARLEEEQLQRRRATMAAIQREAAKLPSCDAAQAVDGVKAKFELRGLVVRRLDKPTDDADTPIGGSEQDPARICHTEVTTNAGRVSLTYSIRWMDSGHFKLLINVLREGAV